MCIRDRVQGGLLDFNSGYYSNIIGVEGGAYYVYKLGARADMSTRWYLDGDKSFGFALGAVKIKPSENSLLKLGRFGTDYSYGSLPYRIPLMAGSSQRTLRTVSCLLYTSNATGNMKVLPNCWKNSHSVTFGAVFAVIKRLLVENNLDSINCARR